MTRDIHFVCLFFVHGIKLGNENHITPLALKTTFWIYNT